jgi:hypothetical protein
VDPGAVLPDIHHLQQVGIKPRLLEEPAEGDFVELGRTRRDDHPIKMKVLDIFEDFGLTGLGAGVEMVAADRYLGEILPLYRQGLGTYDPGDIEAAVANIQADAEFWFHESLSYQLSAISFQLFNEGGKHLLYLDGPLIKFFIVRILQESQVPSEKQVVFQLTGRPHCYLQKTGTESETLSHRFLCQESFL